MHFQQVASLMWQKVKSNEQAIKVLTYLYKLEDAIDRFSLPCKKYMLHFF